jgi:hypothetical protein
MTDPRIPVSLNWSKVVGSARIVEPSKDSDEVTVVMEITDPEALKLIRGPDYLRYLSLDLDDGQ